MERVEVRQPPVNERGGHRVQCAVQRGVEPVEQRPRAKLPLQLEPSALDRVAAGSWCSSCSTQRCWHAAGQVVRIKPGRRVSGSARAQAQARVRLASHLEALRGGSRSGLFLPW